MLQRSCRTFIVDLVIGPAFGPVDGGIGGFSITSRGRAAI